MNAFQPEFNFLGESENELRIAGIEKHLAEIQKSMEKVRKRLFAEVGELKKICSALQSENQYLKEMVERKKFENKEKEWVYLQGDTLFDVSEHRERCG